MASSRPRGGRHSLPRRVVWNPHSGRRTPRYDWRRFPPPVPGSQAIYILKGCLWCRTGDLGWDVSYAAYHCIACGWIEWERPRQKEEVCS